MRYLTAGESHGVALVGILEGFPAGVPVTAAEIDAILARRWRGYGRGDRRRLEDDRVEILSGVRYGRTIGSPLALLIWNRDAPNWEKFMAVSGSRPEDAPPLLVPRPGHADLAGVMKFGTGDVRDIRERASARETAIRTALSVPARELLHQLSISSVAFVIQVGDICSARACAMTLAEVSRGLAKVGPEFATPDPEVVPRWKALIDEARHKGESLGGVCEIRFAGLPPGLGSHTHWDRRLDGRLARVLMAIPGVHAVEIGEGLKLPAMNGSAAQDQISWKKSSGYTRATNMAGGLEGGMTNGEHLVLRCFMKPVPGGASAESVELWAHRPTPLFLDRSDTVAIAPLSLVAESVIALELADALQEKFGGDSLNEMARALNSYRKALKRL